MLKTQHSGPSGGGVGVGVGAGVGVGVGGEEGGVGGEAPHGLGSPSSPT